MQPRDPSGRRDLVEGMTVERESVQRHRADFGVAPVIDVMKSQSADLSEQFMMHTHCLSFWACRFGPVVLGLSVGDRENGRWL